MENRKEKQPNAFLRLILAQKARSGYWAIDPSRRWMLFAAQVPLLAAVIIAIDPLIVAGDYLRATIIVLGAITSVFMFITLVYHEAFRNRELLRQLQQLHGT